MRRVRLCLLAALAVSSSAPVAHPLATPDNFELHPALELSLFAAEPDVVDPVAIAFDEFGRAYVAEMRDYPYGVGPDGKVGSSLRLLEDTDGDGRADRSTVFARDLSFATSVAPWRGGVLVTAPPDLLFLKDTDGDGVADLREVVVTGFRRGVSDSLVNGLRFHFDGWIHGANGGSGGTLASPRRPGVQVRLGDRDFRFRPDTGEIGLTAHTGGGFGLVFDDWGRSFTTYNINHIQQRVADADALTRFPGAPAVETTQSISDHGDMARIFPVAPAVTRPNHPEQAGHFSAAGGMGHIGHAAWPGNLPGSVLVCDVVGNLVHRDVLAPDGPILRASRAPEEQDREFFASRDVDFRPVNLELGPDGALYLLDMQREIIEHPDYIPKKTLAGQDVRAGQDRGRIYRLLPKGAPKTRDLPGRATSAELVAMLGSPNQWTRLTAHRLLHERGESAVVPALKDILHGRMARKPDPAWEPAKPEARDALAALWRLHALTLLDGLAALDEASLLAALGDKHPRIRVAAVRLAAKRATESPRVAAAVQRALADPDAAVRLEASLAAAALPRSPELVAALGAQLRPADVHVWNRRAVLAALATADEAWTVLRGLLADAGFTAAGEGRARSPSAPSPTAPDGAGDTAQSGASAGPESQPQPSSAAVPTAAPLPSYAAIAAEEAAGRDQPHGPREETVHGLAELIAGRPGGEDGKALGALLERLADGTLTEPLVVAALAGLNDGLARALEPPAAGHVARAALARLLDTPSKRQLAAAWRAARALGLPETPAQRQALTRAQAVATSPAETVPARVDALRLLDLGEFGEVAPTLFSLLKGVEPAGVQQAALAVLRAHAEPEVGEGLVRAWPTLAPALRPAVVNLLAYRRAFQPALVTALEEGRLTVGELNLDLEQRRALLRQAAPEVRARAAKFVSDEEYANRSALVEEWLAKLPPAGDPARGRPVFERACAQCHVAAGMGFHVGPDLSGLGHRSVEDLLSNILDPNMAMNPAYATFVAELDDGEEEMGILAAETPGAVTLLQAGGRRVEIPRGRLKSLRSTGRSLMPEGLEAGVTPQELRDLIALLQARP